MFRTTPLEKFESLIRIRIFLHFLAPFNLIEEAGVKGDEVYTCKKTTLLDAFIEQKNVLEHAKLINTVYIKSLLKTIKEDSLSVENLLYDLAYLFTIASEYPFMPTPVLVEVVTRNKKLSASADTRQKTFYSEVFERVKSSVLYFTQLEAKGSNNNVMKKEFEELINALLYLLPNNTKPFILFQALVPISTILLDSLKMRFNLDIMQDDFIEQCSDRLSEEVANDIHHFFASISALQRRASKAKRVSSEFRDIIKDSMVLYIISSIIPTYL